MRDRDYYPAGAYNDPNAPYNQHDNDPIEVDCDTVVSLRKTITVETTNYYEEFDDETGASDIHLMDGYNDLEEYVGKQHIALTDLLEELAKYINGELQGDISNTRKCQLRRMLEDCQDWEQDYIEVEDHQL